MKNRGIKYWLILLSCCGLTASSIGIVVNTIGVFYTPVSTALGVSNGTFTMHATLCLIATGIIVLLIPKIMEKVSLKMMVFVGAAVTSIATFFMGLSNNVIQFYILGILRGLGAGVYGAFPVTVIINNWFYKKHGMVTSLALSFSGVAGALLSPVFTSLIETIGWQHTYFVVAILTFVLVLPFILIPFELHPEDENKLPYLLDINEVKENEKQTTEENSSFKISQPKFVLFFIVVILLMAISGIPSHLPSYALSIGYTATLGSLMLSACMIGNIGSKLIIGVLSDLLGITKSFIIMIIVNIVALFMFMVFKNSWALLIASVLVGSIYSIAAVGLALMTREYFGENNYSSAYSIIQSVINFSSAVAVTLIGYLYDFTASYSMVFIIGLIINVVAILILNMVKKMKTV